MFCSQCGAAIPTGAAFCSRCGAPVGIAPAPTVPTAPAPSPGAIPPPWGAAPPPSAVVPPPAWPPAPSQRSSTGPLLLDLGICGLIALILFGLNVVINTAIGWPMVTSATQISWQALISNIIQWTLILAFVAGYFGWAFPRKKTFGWRLLT